MLIAAGRKLHSQRGASLSIALLLFLVCLAVSSVVITAGTAAAGRLSELREMDQRYYSVTSAAELMRDLMTENPVEFAQEKTTTIGDPEPSVTTTIGNSVLSRATAKLIFGEDANTMDAWLLNGADAADEEINSFTMIPNKPNALKVAVKARIEDEQLVFYFKNAEDDAAGQFCVKLTCTPDVPSAGAASTDPNAAPDEEILQRTVFVTWSRENCVIERTGNW